MKKILLTLVIAAVLLNLVVNFSILACMNSCSPASITQANYQRVRLVSREKFVTERTSEIFLRELELPS